MTKEIKSPCGGRGFLFGGGWLYQQSSFASYVYCVCRQLTIYSMFLIAIYTTPLIHFRIYFRKSQILWAYPAVFFVLAINRMIRILSKLIVSFPIASGRDAPLAHLRPAIRRGGESRTFVVVIATNVPANKLMNFTNRKQKLLIAKNQIWALGHEKFLQFRLNLIELWEGILVYFKPSSLHKQPGDVID